MLDHESVLWMPRDKEHKGLWFLIHRERVQRSAQELVNHGFSSLLHDIDTKGFIAKRNKTNGGMSQ